MDNLLQLQEAFCGRFSALSHESATEREFWLLQNYGKFVAQKIRLVLLL
jgi:hypothetical protein